MIRLTTAIKIPLCCLALLLITGGIAAQECPDSMVVFRFKPSQEQFWADMKDNRHELRNLGRFLGGHRAAILRGEKPIFVNGYAKSMPTDRENMVLAKVRSNRVKSHMILKYRFKEEFFCTKNHADSAYGSSEMVLVSFVPPNNDIVATPPIEEEPADTLMAELPQPEVDSVAVPVIENTLANSSAPAFGDETSLMGNQNQTFEDPRSYALLEKKSYFVSLYANFSNAGKYNLLIEPLFEIHKMYNRNVDVQVAGGYFIANNLALGAYAGYRMSDIRVDVSSDMLQLLINSRRYETNNVSAGYTLGVFSKNFIPLEYAHRIFLVNEASIYYSQTRSLSRNVYDQGAMLSKVYQNTYTGGIKLSVGVMYFLANGLTMEFNISPVAALYQYNTVVNNETLNGKFAGGAINTILLPIDLKFGLTYFFGLDYKKNRKHINTVQNALLN